jgi:uncharacterized protein YdeI (YjbR/CyaY-like superfamily)
MIQHPKVDDYFSKLKNWNEEMELLRTIVLECGLNETLKWGEPCYTFLTGENGNKEANILLIHGFKGYCALLFMKGALLQDAKGLLVQQTENVQSGRQIRFTNVREIVKLKQTLKAYIFEAIEVEKAGLKVEFAKSTNLEFPVELQNKLTADTAFKTAFEALTPGRQRAYNLFFSAAKQPKTRESRIEESVQRIMNGKGLNDCTCGLSRRMPNCDGSHKLLQAKN